MRVVNLHITTTDSVQPGGTVDAPFVYTITPKVDGGFTATQTDSGTMVSFADVPVGDYTASAVKFGVTASADFTVIDVVVPPDTVTFQVPSAIDVALA